MNLVDFLMEHETVTKVVIVAVHAASAVVLFLMVTRRGWWKPTGPDIDWATTDGCPRCWEHGPYPGWEIGTLSDPERSRDLHQAWHELTAALLGPAFRWAEHKTWRTR